MEGVWLTDIGSNYKGLRDEIDDDVKIIAATKNRGVEEIKEAVDAGVKDLGENYVYPESVNKYQELGKLSGSINWHVIGHLQTNKINKALPIFSTIQTVESEYRALNINKRAKRQEMRNKRLENDLNEVVSVFIQVNISKEESKFGIYPSFQKIKNLLNKVKKMNYIEAKGLMTMGRKTKDMSIKRKEFREMKNLFDEANQEISDINLKYLSMGMSNTYDVAVEEGANMVRIGRGIFGERS